MKEQRLPDKILDLLKEESKRNDYINPNFLLAISELLDSYYDAGDDDVDQWIISMYGH